MSSTQIRSNLDRILQFLEPYKNLINCHMVNYLIDQHWETFIPENIRNEIQTEKDINEALEIFWENEKIVSNKFTNWKKFIAETEKYRLENLKDILTTNILNQTFEIGSFDTISIKEFMSEKKRHEVEITANLIARLIKDLNYDEECFIVDAGDGKGYLSSRLNLEFQFKVLGIDASEINTIGAIERKKKLERAWDGLIKRADLISQGLTPVRRGNKSKINSNSQKTPSSDNYKTINQFITVETDFPGLLKTNFQLSDNKNFKICLTGLHTCGNLASTCLKTFITQNDVNILCNIGCCYHLLNEEFSKNEYFSNEEILLKNSDYGFPLSEYLKGKQFNLGRNARMLASQSIYRVLSQRELPNKSLFYRSLLEIVINEKLPNSDESIQIGKIKKFTTFQEYFLKCNKKLNLNIKDFDEIYFDDLLEKFDKDSKLMNLFYLIRMLFAPIIETIILLDRLLYLKENNIENSFLIRLFDSIISPRCFGIIAFK